RNLYRTITYIPRVWHRHGFGVQSPSDYELVRDVLCERLSYYAYREQNMKKETERLLYRLRLHYGDRLVCSEADSFSDYDKVLHSNDDTLVFFLDNISYNNLPLWKYILNDSRARVTFDMGNCGLVIFNQKRIKQNYLL
nr:hypothetical protein [Bacteroidaceae bacterium]